MALATEKISAPALGIDDYSAAAYVNDTHGIVVRNVLPARLGRTPMRGAITVKQKGRAALSVSSTGADFSRMWYGAASGGSQAGLIYDPAGTPRYLEYGSGLSGSSQPTVIVAPGSPRQLLPSFASVGGFVWGSDGVLIRWTPGGASVLRRTAATPTSPTCVGEYNSRLFIANGYHMYWSDVGGPVSDVAASWTDDVTGLLNQIQLADQADPIVAFARVDRALVILRKHSIYRLTGDTPGNYDVRRVAEVGCVTADGVLEYDNGVFFQSREGIMFFDGVAVKCISNPLNLSAIGGPRYMCERVGREFVMFHLMQGTNTTGSPVTVSLTPRWMLFHVPTESWTELSLHPNVGAGVPAGFWQADDSAHVIGENGNSYTLVGLIGPYSILSDGDPYGYVNSVSQAPLLAITSRVVRLSSPTKKVQLHRILVDYVLKDATAALALDVRDELGVALLPSVIVLPGAATAVRQRAVVDAFVEASSLQLVWTFSPGTTPGDVEVHDVWVEYQASSDRTG